jgi:hypothetical protein
MHVDLDHKVPQITVHRHGTVLCTWLISGYVCCVVVLNGNIATEILEIGRQSRQPHSSQYRDGDSIYSRWKDEGNSRPSGPPTRSIVRGPTGSRFTLRDLAGIDVPWYLWSVFGEIQSTVDGAFAWIGDGEPRDSVL